MTIKGSPKKTSLKKSIIQKTDQTYLLPKQNQVSLDYYQKKKAYDEHLLEPLRPKIFTVKQHLPNKKFNYFVFTGPQNFEISSILKKIQISLNNHNFQLELSERKKLLAAFGENYKESLGFHYKNYQEFQYIFMLIDEEDTIENIKKKINIYINPNIKVNSQYLWINFGSNNRLMYQKKNKYFLKISNDRQVYVSTLVNSLSSISGQKCSPSLLGLSQEVSQISFSEFDNISNLSKYIDFSHETLGFVYNDISGLVLMNPFDDKSTQKFEMSPLDKKKYILMNYGDIQDNFINLVVFKDFHQKNPDFKNVSKFWPYLKNESKFDFDSERKVFENISKISNYIYLNSQSPKIHLKSHYFQQVIININSFDEVSKTVEKEDFINLDKIFDIIDLSYEYPFVRYNEGLLDNMKYKIFKPITDNGQNGKPFIDKDKLTQWSNIKKKGKVKRGIHIYQLFGQKEQENEFQKIAVSTDGKIELRVTWKNIKANYVDIERSIEKCQRFINYLNNNINYNIKINSDEKIKIPMANINNYYNLTTEISSINCLMTIQTAQAIEISSLFDYCREYLYNFVSIEIKKENNVDKGLILRYKRIDNFKYENVVYTFLEQNYKINISRDIDIINKINELYRIGKDKALLLLNDYKKKASYESYNNQLKRNLKSKSDGYHIQINKQFNKLFKVSMSVKNPDHLKYIIHFLKTLFSLVIEKKVLELDNVDESNDIDKLVESVNSSLSSDNSDNLLSEIGDDHESLSDDEDEDDIGIDLDYLNELTPEIIEQKNVFEESEKKPNKNGTVPIDSRYIINRLKEYDNKIFNFNKGNSKSKSGYTKMCQGNEGRQPIVITQKEKDNIDKKFKGSYSEALKYNSDPSKDNYYICPYIWCAKCNVSLRPKDVKNNKNESMSCPICGGVPFDNSKKNISKGTLFVKKQNFWTAKWESEFPSNDKWKQMYPSFLDPKKKSESDFCLPCCFKNKDTPKDIFSKEVCLNNKVIETKKNDKFEKYVSGCKKFPLDENRLGLLPSILNDILENNLKEAFGEGEGGNLQDDVPIFLRKGISQSKNNSLIYSVISLSHDSNSKHQCVSNDINEICDKITVDLFLSLNDGDLISIFYDDHPLDEDTFKIFYKWILDRKNELKQFIDYELFKKIRKMSIMSTLDEEIKYTFLKIYEIYNSFNNFINYLKSDKIKDEQLLWELLSKKGIIFDDDVNIIIFEIIEDKVYQMCPKWFNDQYINFNKDTCLLYKQSNRFEPIFNILGHNTDKIVARHSMGRLSNTSDLVEIENGNKILLYSMKSIEFIMRNAYNFCLEIENNNYKKHMIKKKYLYSHRSKQIYECLASIKHKNYHPFYQIANDNFKSVAFIINDINNSHSKKSELENKILIPFIPSRIIPNIPVIFGMHHYIPNKYQTTIETLFDIESITKKNIHSPIDFIILPKERVVNEQLKTYLINTSTNYLIPVKEEKVSDKYPVINNNLDINLDYKINKFEKLHDTRETEMSKYKLENNLFEQFRFEMSKIIANALKEKSDKSIYFKHNIFIEQIPNIINSPILSIDEKTSILEQYIWNIIHISDSFYFDSNNKIDIHQPFNQKTRKICSSNKEKHKCSIKNLCFWDKNKCKFYIPQNNLINTKINNQKKYVIKLVEQLVRNNIKKNEILRGTVSEVISNSINPNEIIITEDNFETEIEELYSKNDNILYNKNYPDKGYDNYFIDNKFVKKPVPHKCLVLLKDSYIYHDVPHIQDKKEISIKSLSLIANDEDIHVKKKLLEYILDNNYKEVLKKYHLLNSKDYQFIKNQQEFSLYFMNEHYLNLIDIEIFSKLYSQNIIIVYERIGNYINLFKNNKSDKYYIILIIESAKGQESVFLCYSVSLEDNFLFDYESFSSGLKLLMERSSKSHLYILPDVIREKKSLKKKPRYFKSTVKNTSISGKKSISKSKSPNKIKTHKHLPSF